MCELRNVIARGYAERYESVDCIVFLQRLIVATHPTYKCAVLCGA